MTLRVAIAGCGKIADQHLQAIRRVDGCQVVAACDREPLMAAQLAERFSIPACFTDVAEMLQACSPDVVHITTPPQSHYALARRCIEAGVHAYVEKPFTVTAEETEALLAFAERRRVKIAAGHNCQFALEMIEMRRLVQGGFLGGPAVHVESHWSYDLGDASYVGPLLNDRAHWVRCLPGQLLQNVMSHAVARLAEFLADPLEELSAIAHQSAALRSLGGGELLDELRVLIRDARGTTAFLSFSTGIRPPLNQLRVCGPTNSILVDQASGALVRQRAATYKSYLTYFVPPVIQAGEQLRSARRNVAHFVGRRLYQDAGMTELVGRFYRSIRTNGPIPIPYREIALTSRIIDGVFSRIEAGRRQHALAAPA